jgi:uncharacterized oxidoreductase
MANLSGHDSHGVGMLPRYVDAVLEGGLTPNAQVKTCDAGALLSLNGQRGYGQVVGEQAMLLGMERAKQQGSCILALAESHHLGRIGHFAEMAVAQGLVSLHFVNVMTRPVVAPWGGADGRYGTNPCCIGIPLKDSPPFVLDFATSRVAQGKMRVAHNQGKAGAARPADRRARPADHRPRRGGGAAGQWIFRRADAFRRAQGLRPGRGLRAAGRRADRRRHLAPPDGEHVRAVYNSMLTILIDPGKLGTQSAMETEALAFVEWLRKSPPADGEHAVQIAGEPERRARVERERDGIEIDASTWEEIVGAGRQGRPHPAGLKPSVELQAAVQIQHLAGDEAAQGDGPKTARCAPALRVRKSVPQESFAATRPAAPR